MITVIVAGNPEQAIPTATRDEMSGSIVYDGPEGLFPVMFAARYFRNVVSVVPDTTVFQVVGPDALSGLVASGPSFPAGFAHLRSLPFVGGILNLRKGNVFKFLAQGTDPGWFVEANSFTMMVL